MRAGFCFCYAQKKWRYFKRLMRDIFNYLKSFGSKYFLILSNFSQYHLNVVDIVKKFSHIGILRKNSHFSGFNILSDVMYIIVLIKYLFLQLGFCC